MKDKQTTTGERTVVEEEIIPVVEERARIEKRVIAGRTVTVRTRPVSETVKLSESLSRETVSVERHRVGRVVTEIPDIREEGGTTVLPVVEERIRVVRELVLVEEIHLKRERSSEKFEAEVEQRRTIVEIDEE